MQRTISRVVRIGGIGLHTGEECIMTLYPAPEDTGIVFIHNKVQLPAIIFNVADTKLATTLRNVEGLVMTIEHLMAALYAKKINNCFIYLSAHEVPILDGSAEPFVRLLEEAGIELQDKTTKLLKVKKEVKYESGDRFVKISPAETRTFEVDIEYDHPMINKQKAKFDFYKDSFTNDISYARTFGFEKDIEKMQTMGYALGGSLKNAVLLMEDGSAAGSFRYENEFARHKILDAIGDLALSGFEIRGAFYGYKSGHSLNIELVRKLLSDKSAYEIVIS